MLKIVYGVTLLLAAAASGCSGCSDCCDNSSPVARLSADNLQMAQRVGSAWANGMAAQSPEDAAGAFAAPSSAGRVGDLGAN